MRQGRHEALITGLAWFSIGLGLAELLAPRAVARVAGLGGRERLLRWYGAREFAAGAALLLLEDKRAGLWARVAGDALDLATLSQADSGQRGAAMAAVAGVTALDVAAARGARSRARPSFDYSARSGFPRPPHEMRGLARARVAAKSEPVA